MTSELRPFSPNLQVELPPSRDSVPGGGGFLTVPDRVALPPRPRLTPEEWTAKDRERKLQRAPDRDRQRLAVELKRLTDAELRASAAEQAVEVSRNEVIKARVDGRDARKYERAHEAAVAEAGKARRDAAIQADVASLLRDRIIGQVRKGMEDAARKRMADAQRRYDEALEDVARAVRAFAVMRAARADEAQGAAELAEALGELPLVHFNGRWDEAPTGPHHRTIPESVDELQFMAGAASLADIGPLRRGKAVQQEERPTLRPIDT